MAFLLLAAGSMPWAAALLFIDDRSALAGAGFLGCGLVARRACWRVGHVCELRLPPIGPAFVLLGFLRVVCVPVGRSERTLLPAPPPRGPLFVCPRVLPFCLFCTLCWAAAGGRHAAGRSQSRWPLLGAASSLPSCGAAMVPLFARGLVPFSASRGYLVGWLHGIVVWFGAALRGWPRPPAFLLGFWRAAGAAGCWARARAAGTWAWLSPAFLGCASCGLPAARLLWLSVHLDRRAGVCPGSRRLAFCRAGLGHRPLFACATARAGVQFGVASNVYALLPSWAAARGSGDFAGACGAGGWRLAWCLPCPARPLADASREARLVLCDFADARLLLADPPCSVVLFRQRHTAPSPPSYSGTVLVLQQRLPSSVDDALSPVRGTSLCALAALARQLAAPVSRFICVRGGQRWALTDAG